jgi:hemerythrin
VPVPLIDPEAIPQVALEFINQDHREEALRLDEVVEAVGALRAGRTGPEPVVARLEALFDHTRDHFAREDQVMREYGFPPYPVHHGEHERVLEELAAEGRHFGETADADRLHAYLTVTVPAWLMDHIQTMDRITAQFVVSRGG